MRENIRRVEDRTKQMMIWILIIFLILKQIVKQLSIIS